MAKTMCKFRGAAINCDLHNKREKENLPHTRKDLEPENPSEWIWEAEGKKSIYQMRKQAEKEYHQVEVIAKGKYGEYTTHKTLPKNAVPVKEAIVRIGEHTSLADVRKWADLMEKKYGIRAVGIYVHKDEGHWDILKAGQTEDMYRRNDGKEWKRKNQFGEWEYWKPNLHAHVVFDWFDHRKGRCISLGKEVMSAMEDDLAAVLGMERGIKKAVSGVKAMDTWDWKRKKEAERVEELYRRGKKKIGENQKTMDSQVNDIRRLEIKVKGLSTMIANLEGQKKVIEDALKKLQWQKFDEDLVINDAKIQKEELLKQLAEVEEKLAGKKKNLTQAEQELDTLTLSRGRVRKQLAELSEQLNNDKPRVEQRVLRDIESLAWRQTVNQCNNLINQINALKDYDWMPSTAKWKIEDFVNDSQLADIAERGKTTTEVAAALFLGYLDAAMQMAQAGGGGGGGTGDWSGKQPGEDDRSFMNRCLQAARMMMRPAGRRKGRSL